MDDCLQVFMDCFVDGSSMDVMDVNWMHATEMFEKLDIAVPQRVVDGVRNYKDGAAELLLEQLYQYFTGQPVRTVRPAHRVDFTDHAYQVYR